MGLPKRGRALQFSAHLCCGQRAGCIKMPLGVEVRLSPGDFVLDADPAPLPKNGAQPAICGPCLLWPKGWMDKDVTWYRGRPRPKRQCVTWRPSPPPEKKAQPLIFGLCLLWLIGCMYQDTSWCTGRPQPRRQCVRCGPSSPPLKEHSPNFRPMSVMVKRLDALRCHLVWRYALAQATFCSIGTQLTHKKKGTAPPNFWPMSIVAKRLDGSRCRLVPR